MLNALNNSPGGLFGDPNSAAASQGYVPICDKLPMFARPGALRFFSTEVAKDG